MTEHEMLHKALNGNADAIALCDLLARVSQTWDDLIDLDKPVQAADINAAFVSCLSGLPRNAFYRAHWGELQPLIEAAILDWQTANALEPDPSQRMLAWALRDNLAGVIIGAAKIIGGMEWAAEQAVMVRRFIHDEPLGEYRNG